MSTTVRIPASLRAEVDRVAAENDELLTDAVIEGLKLYLAARRRSSQRSRES